MPNARIFMDTNGLGSHLLVLFDVHNAIFAIPQALCWIVTTKPLDQIVSITADLLRKLNHINSLQNDVVGLHGIRAREWRTGSKWDGLLGVKRFTLTRRSLTLTSPSVAQT